MSTPRQILGRQGEARAALWLKRRGYKILETNYRNRYGEMDIIARRGMLLVFVEVKTRSGGAYGLPCEAVGYRKQETLRRVALGYLQERELLEQALRFDVIEVLPEGGKWVVRHIEQAF